MNAQVSTGMVPEEISWPSGSGNTVSQMPTIPWALLAIYNKTGDASFLQEQVPKVAAYLNWWRTTRGLGDGLVVTVHPWETGIDASPAYDAPWHFTPTGVAAADYATLYLKFPELQTYYKDTWSNNYTAILAQTKAASSLIADWFVVQDIAINTLVAVGWAVLGDLATKYGDTTNAATYYAYNKAHETAIKSRMWNSSLGRFVTTYKDQDGTWQSTSVQTVQSLFPLLMRSLTSAQRAAVIADATSTSKFWTNYPFPSVSKAESTYTPIYVYNLLWRGPSWGFTNWFVISALLVTGGTSDQPTMYHIPQTGEVCRYVVPQYNMHGAYHFASDAEASSTISSDCQPSVTPVDYYFYHGSVGFYSFYEEESGTYFADGWTADLIVHKFRLYNTNGQYLADGSGSVGYHHPY
jgi:hypothetical protein